MATLSPELTKAAIGGKFGRVLTALNHHWYVKLHSDCQAVVDIGNQMLACRATGASFMNVNTGTFGSMYGNIF